MKLKQVEKLLKAARAKSQTENARLAIIRNAQAQLAKEAETLEREGRTPLVAEALTGDEIVSYGRRQRHLERSASARRRDIAELEPLRLKQDGILHKALQEEIAWERIADDAMLAKRKEREAREEERREMLARGRG
jgi:hypothetical protein